MVFAAVMLSQIEWDRDRPLSGEKREGSLTAAFSFALPFRGGCPGRGGRG